MALLGSACNEADDTGLQSVSIELVDSSSSDDAKKKKKQESAMERAKFLQSQLRHPSFVKSMLRSHVTQGFWLGLPTEFCKKYLPSDELKMSLVDELGAECTANYLGRKNGLSGGWQGFAKAHRIGEGDVAVFELIQRTKFKVYIFKGDREHIASNQSLYDVEKKAKEPSLGDEKKKKEKKFVKEKEKKPFLAADSHKVKVEDASTLNVGMYAAQCCTCLKWRVIPTLIEFEEIRENMTAHPFFCHRKANISCKDPEDVIYDSTQTWVIDKPNLPKAPDGFKRNVVVKEDFSACITAYIMPTGEKVRSHSELLRFLHTNPQYKSLVKISDFDFTSPMIMEETLPPKEGAESRTRKKAKL